MVYGQSSISNYEEPALRGDGVFKVKFVKSVEVVTFPGTGFFLKFLMGLVITHENMMVN